MDQFVSHQDACASGPTQASELVPNSQTASSEWVAASATVFCALQDPSATGPTRISGPLVIERAAVAQAKQLFTALQDPAVAAPRERVLARWI